MSESEIEIEVKELLAEHLGLDITDIQTTSKIYEDLGGDSLDRVEIFMKVEVHFDIMITDADENEIDLVSDLCSIVVREMDKKVIHIKPPISVFSNLSISKFADVFKKSTKEELPDKWKVPSPIEKYNKDKFTPPFRVGKKQSKAVLDAKGLEVVFIQDEKQAQLYCNYLNT